jgi:glycosyltransferase involved in cell wall biosynthesis
VHQSGASSRHSLRDTQLQRNAETFFNDMATKPSTSYSKISCFLVIGGQSVSLTNFRQPLIEELLADGFAVETIAGEPHQPSIDRLAALGVGYTPVRLGRTSIDPMGDLRTTRQLVLETKKLQPKAALAYTIKPVIFGLIAARIAGVKNRYALITGLGFGLIGETRKRRLLATVLSGLYRVALLNARTVFFQNPDDERFFQERILRKSTPTAVVRGSGVDLKHFHVTKAPDVTPTKFVFVGRFTVEKGIRELIQATEVIRSSSTRPFEVHTVGWVDPNPAGISQSELQDWIDRGLIHHHGRQDDVRPFLTNSHVLVLPSYREGTPRSVLEAMAMGRAVITTDAPGCREPIVDEETGLMIPIRNVSKLVEAMRRFIDDPSLAQKFGEAGRRRVETHYEASAVARTMVNQIVATLHQS